MKFLHDTALRQYGGVWGVRDESLLLSALERPRNKLAYADATPPDLLDLGAAYAFGIARNHPFNDANKRTAWSSCRTFIRVNGMRPDVAKGDVIVRMLQLAMGQLDEAGFAAWLRGLPQRQPSPEQDKAGELR